MDNFSKPPACTVPGFDHRHFGVKSKAWDPRLLPLFCQGSQYQGIATLAPRHTHYGWSSRFTMYQYAVRSSGIKPGVFSMEPSQKTISGRYA
jgi:hypothetical protein